MVTFVIGRRRLVVSLHVEPRRRLPLDVPEAIAATDAQLVRLACGKKEADRRRHGADLALAGYWPLR